MTMKLLDSSCRSSCQRQSKQLVERTVTIVIVFSALWSCASGFSFSSSIPFTTHNDARTSRWAGLAPASRLAPRRSSRSPLILLKAISSSKPSFGGGSSDYGSNSTDGAMSTGQQNATTLLIVNAPTVAPKRKAAPKPRQSRQEKKEADRFARQAATEIRAKEPVILTIHGLRYNLTEWAHAHPGGAKVLEKYAKSGADAGEAFDRASHSHFAVELLNDFLIEDDRVNNTVMSASVAGSSTAGIASAAGSSATLAGRGGAGASLTVPRKPLWRVKLFTREDPQNIHKFLGIYSLAHFLYRTVRMTFFDPAGGLTGRAPVGKAGFAIAVLSLIPHAVLSLSSLIFHTVPKERVVGRPMIWQEFRMHNILFGLRSVVCALLTLIATRYVDTVAWVRPAAVAGCGAAVLAALALSDVATKRLRANEQESTTATMPYWEGCSAETQRRFKNFYAFSQFMATLACLAVMNPAWPFLVLLPIQIASLLMTLVRKGLLSARGYHYLYAGSLALPYGVGALHTVYMQSLDFVGLLVVGTALYAARKQGVNKYALWVPTVAGRVAFGDLFLNWRIW